MSQNDEYFLRKLAEAEQRVQPGNEDDMLGKGKMQPFNNTNSGARKIMFGVHRDHVFPLMNGSKALIETGYEIRFGDKSSSITKSDDDYIVVSKVSKYSFAPNHHYFLILENRNKKKLDVVERISYFHVTEEYGYLYNNEYLDSLACGSFIPNDQIVQKSLAFDEYNNRKDGENFNVAYMALDQNMEDSIIISQSAAATLNSPLVKTVSVMLNENNIPLNLYGTDDTYKCMPDIGENIKNSILIASRKEKKEELAYSESIENLRHVLMSDEKKILSGQVIDIDIYCNNITGLEEYHNQQFKMYWKEQQRMAHEIVSAVAPYEMNGYEISYDLKKIYAISKRILNGDNFIEKNPFSNIRLDITIIEQLPLREGDKVSNRYGGKGVVSCILPDKLMPHFGPENKVLDFIFNSSTMYNRENPGQIFELSINRVSRAIVNRIKCGDYSIEEAFREIIDFINIIVPKQAEDLQQSWVGWTVDQKRFYLESVVKDGNIQISTRPIEDSFDIDRLNILYKRFPWVELDDIKVPIKGSNGDIRYVSARRKIAVGQEYIYRLKQFAEEKFSATSLASTNIRGENTKSKANKNYNEMYSNTPIRFGNMEINNMNHLGVEFVIQNLLIHSRSPHARRLTEQMYVDNPYDIDIRLDCDSRNRGAEITNVYLKVCGRRLIFKKIPKRRVKLVIEPLYFNKNPYKSPLFFGASNEELQEKYDLTEQKITKTLSNMITHNKLIIEPLKFYAADIERKKKREEENKKAYENMHKNPRDRT